MAKQSANVQRGDVYLWQQYDRLDDPDIDAKDKFLIIINAWLPENPLYYLLTTSRLDKLKDSPFQRDLLTIPAGTYAFFKLDTVINVREAGQLTVECELFDQLWDDGQLLHCGCLTSEDMKAIDQLIAESLQVRPELKRHVTAWE